MARRLAVAVGAAALALVTFALLRSPPDERAAPSPVARAADVVASSAPPREALPPREPAALPEASAEDAEHTRAKTARTIGHLRAARAALARIAAPCVKGHTPAEAPPGTPDETMQRLRFRYMLVLLDGEAHVERFEVLESELASSSLDACVRKALAEARFPYDAEPDVLAVEEGLRVGDLVAADLLERSRGREGAARDLSP